MSACHTGTASAMLRFSQIAVPDGQVPSTGMRLTGISSPRPSSIAAVTSRTNVGRMLRHQRPDAPTGWSPPPAP